MASQPAWQTDELKDEWPDDTSEPHTCSLSLTVPVGSLHSGPSLDQGPGVADVPGTFLIRRDALPVLPQRTPGQSKGLVRDFFSPIALERMFDPPSPGLSALPTLSSSTRKGPSHSSSSPPLPISSLISRIGNQNGPVNPDLPELSTRDAWRENMRCQFTFTVPNPAASQDVASPSHTQARIDTSAAASVVPLADPPLRLFQFQYDTFTRDHLSAMVDSIAINSPSGSNTGNFVVNTPSLSGLSPVSEASPPSNSNELRSAKRVKLSPVSDFDGFNRHTHGGVKRPVYRKDYVGESRSLMALIKNARDFSYLSTATSASSASHPDPNDNPSCKKGVKDQTLPNPNDVHLLEANNDSIAAGPISISRRKGHSSIGYRQQAENFMAQLKQDMKGSKRIFSTDATDPPPIRLAVDQTAESIRSNTGPPPPPFQYQGSRPSPIQGSNSPRISFMDTSAASLNTSRIYAHFPAPPILVAPPPSPPPQPPDPIPQPNATALEVGTRANTLLLTPTTRTGSSATLSVLGRPNEDLNRFVSSSTVSGTTLTTGSLGSFVKHPGPAQITRIGPEDVPALPERVGKMVFDKVMMRWVKAAVTVASKIPEGGGVGNAATSDIDAESEDPFRDIESLREDSLVGDGAGEHAPPSTDNSYIDEVGDEEEMELTSFSFDGPSHGLTRAATTGGEDDTTDSDNDDEDVTEISSLSASLSLAGPPEISFDPDSSDEETHRQYVVTLVKGTAGPSREIPVPTPIRSALKSATASPAVSFVDPLISNHCTPASKPGHRRSVSFSDGKREGPIRGLGRGKHGESGDGELPTEVPVGEASFEPSARSKRIGKMLGGLECVDDMAPSRTTSFAHPSASALPPGIEHSLGTDNTSETEVPTSDVARCVPARSQHSSWPKVAILGVGTQANATFLTEASFGVAHDKLVQVITDTQPFEPYWERLSSIDLSNRNIESVARLKEFLPRLHTLSLNSNQLAWLSGVPITIRSLSVSRNSLTSATSFSHLLSLEYLDISYNTVESLSQLDCLRHLRELRADGNLIRSLDGLQRMDCLVKLSLQRNHIVDIDFTQGSWPRLEVLNVSQNRIQDVSGLSFLPSLVVLNLDNNSLDELEPHGILPRLRILRLSANRLKCLDASHFPNLRTLYIDNNSLIEIKKANRLVKLENLSLRNQGGNGLSLSIRDVRDAKRLYLSGNALPAEFLSEPCYNLIYLEIAACRLSRLPANFATLVPNLRVLNLNYNFLDDVKPLDGLRRLKKLTIIGSRLKGTKGIITVLRACPDVEMVDFRMNPCTLGWYLPLLVKDVPGALQPSEAAHHPSGENHGECAIKLSGPNLGQTEEAGKSTRGGNRDSPRDGTSCGAPTLAWHELDAKFRRDLPDEAYIGRLTYRGLIMRACPRVRMLDGVVVSRKEREKAEKLLEGVARAKG